VFRKTPLAWLQLTRQKGRLLVTLAGVAFAVILMFVQLGFRDALFEDAVSVHKTLQADLVLISTKSEFFFATSPFPRSRLYDALGFEGVAEANPLYMSRGEWKYPQQKNSHIIYVLAFNPDKPVFNLPEVNQNLDQLSLTDIMFFDRLSRPEFGSVVADFEQGKNVTAEVLGHQIKIGKLFSIGGGVMSADGLLIASDSNFLRLFDRPLEQINLGLIQLQPNTDVRLMRNTLTANLPKDVRIMTRSEFWEFEKQYWRKSTPIGFIFRLGSAMGFFVGAVIVYQILYTDVTEHLAEYAVLKAMGYTQSYLLGVVLQEALIIATLGYIPGMAISLIIYDVTRNAVRLPMTTDLNKMLSLLGLTVLMCFIAGAIAVRKLKAADPADIFS
jgi:putative ABC transport system permease protein